MEASLIVGFVLKIKYVDLGFLSRSIQLVAALRDLESLFAQRANGPTKKFLAQFERRNLWSRLLNAGYIISSSDKSDSFYL